jgi:hypothetical protein
MLRFDAVQDPSPDILDAISAVAPCNPFNSASYATARGAHAQRIVALLLRDHAGTLIAGCVGYQGGRTFARILEIPSVADLPTDVPDAARMFWNGVAEFCRANRIAELDVGSYATQWLILPQLNAECSRRNRVEYVLDLGDTLNPSSNHRRNINRARKLGASIRRTNELTALDEHTRLMSASMDRRERRGEAVPTVRPDPVERSLLRGGAAELFQAHVDGETLSSILVLHAPRGAYYQSAGTSPSGMEQGASQFLIASVADVLRTEGVEVFNLGGAGDDAPGLQRFKAAFGARTVSLEAARFTFGTSTVRAARRFTAKALGLASRPLRMLRSNATP